MYSLFFFHTYIRVRDLYRFLDVGFVTVGVYINRENPVLRSLRRENPVSPAACFHIHSYRRYEYHSAAKYGVCYFYIEST